MDEGCRMLDVIAVTEAWSDPAQGSLGVQGRERPEPSQPTPLELNASGSAGGAILRRGP